MSRHYISYEAICPFYHAEGKNIIYCEGVNSNTTIHNAFAGNAWAYKREFCCDSAGWKKCIIAKALWSKYEDGGIP